MSLRPSAELRKLNNYPEFKTTPDINAVMRFIQSNDRDRAFPPSINTNRKRERYIEKFGGRSGFVVQNATLFYKKPGLQINLEVVYPDQRQQKIQSIYDDITRGLGVGLGQFFQQVSLKYLNIKKEDTDTFLRKQGDYKVTRTPKKSINAPIIAKVPNERWGIDLIDMRAFSGEDADSPKWILSVVDYYSSKAFARHMPNKTLATIHNKMDEICRANNTYPHILQADNEFHAGNPNQRNILQRWCDDHNIEFVRTLSYTPTSNGRIERMNRSIRTKIRAGFARNNNNEWVQYLDDYIENINNQQIVRTRQIPNTLWVPGYDNQDEAIRGNRMIQTNPQGRITLNIPKRRDNMTANDMRSIAQAQQFKRVQDMLAKSKKQYGKPGEFHVGDKVRISLFTISNKMREARKEKRTTKISVNWSPEIYIITHRHINVQGLKNTSYFVKNAATGVPVTNQPRRPGLSLTPQRFYANELIMADKAQQPPNAAYAGFVPSTIPSTRRALEINKVIG